MRCSNCPNKYQYVPAEGPTDSGFLFIGDTGSLPYRAEKEFTRTYLPLAGLHRDEIRITPTVRCRAEDNCDHPASVVQSCIADHLPQEVRECEPSIIVLMGALACSLIPNLKLDTEHGIPRHVDNFIGTGWSGMVVPMYHPSLGVWDTGKMIPLLEDFKRLRDPEYLFPTAPRKVDYRLIDRIPTIRPNSLLAIDTEDHAGVPFSIQISNTANTGYMILLEGNEQLLHVLNAQIQLSKCTVVLHNAIGDLDLLERMGILIPKWIDTMQLAYHHGNLPQGLKPLAYRLFGVRMRSWEDVVKPHSQNAVLNWLEAALGVVNETQKITTIKQLKTKVKYEEKAGHLQRAYKRILRYGVNNPDYDVWDKLDETHTKFPDEFALLHTDEEVAARVTNRLLGVLSPGPLPKLGIGNVPLDEAVQYGCGDADLTLQAAIDLIKLQSSERYQIDPSDIDK